MTEARVWTFVMILCLAIGAGCIFYHQWLGLIGAAFAVWNGYCARWYLVRWKPSSLTE